jgi:prepilin-type N-terminal cleavage/methylation domain-containing protein
MRRAFTLIELIVAVGILAVILSVAGVIFRVSTESRRMAMANAEIMQKLRVITGQLNADFRGLVIEYDGYSISSTQSITEQTAGGEPRTSTIHSDGLFFFANGDFQSTGQYGGKTIVGNVAGIYYGAPDPNSYRQVSESGETKVVLPAPRDRLLLRRQTILAPEAPQAGSQPDGEYYCLSLEEWRTQWRDKPEEWYRQPVIVPNDLQSQLPMYLAKGVGDFAVHYLAAGTDLGTDAIAWQRRDSGGSGSISPAAFKVTFTLYDSKGIIENGRTFTHIVLVGG